MVPVFTAEDVVRRIAAECAYVDEHGGLGIRVEPAARDRQYGGQFRARQRQRWSRPVKTPSPPPSSRWRRRFDTECRRKSVISLWRLDRK
jgi:hypothetical protein